MGLDMFLVGYDPSLKTASKEWWEPGQIELGYWRKHPNLHGYIVDTFAGGEDECQQIDLTVDDLKDILQAVDDDQLPHTEGFFFGTSRSEDRLPTIKILKEAIAWLNADSNRSVYYRASW